MIVRAIKVGHRRPAIDFLNEVQHADVDLYAKLEDLIERVWQERNPPPRLPRDATENYGNGLNVLKARGKEKWGRIAYTYHDESAIVLLDGLFKDQNSLPDATIKEWHRIVARLQAGTVPTFIAWQTKRS